MNFDTYLLNLSPSLEELLSSKTIDPEGIAGLRQRGFRGGDVEPRTPAGWSPHSPPESAE